MKQKVATFGALPGGESAVAAGLVGRRPRLLFFQWDHSPNRGLSDYFVTHMTEHARCLGEHFDVTVISQDCDYSEMCDRYEPDVALFESGFQTFVSRRPEITNIHGNDGIPRIGLHNADAWSDCRSGFLADMDRWGIETFFSICATTHEYMPKVKDRTFIWPNFIDPGVFRDYGIEKVVPVMICGQHHEAYPWRAKVFPELQRMFPAIVCPTFHYGSALGNRTLAGESYARALNASHFSPACGTVAGEVVRKHLEIPGAKSCLIAQESEALKEAGFVHMENCVFSEPESVVVAVDSLLGNRDLLNRITENGHRLVHDRHTLRHRPQIHQWFQLQRQLAGNDRIVQRGPFADLVIERAVTSDSPIFVSRGASTAALREAEAHLWADRSAEARRGFNDCLKHVKYLPEARFGLALCDLQDGRPREAAAILAGLIEGTVESYGAADPDPVEWVYFIVSVLAQGEVGRAERLAGWFPGLAHPERRHLDKVFCLATGRQIAEAQRGRVDRPSIHYVPERDSEAWAAWLAIVLRRCGQTEISSRLAGISVGEACSGIQAGTGRGLRLSFLRAVDLALQLPGLVVLKPGVPPEPEFRYFHWIALNAKRHVMGVMPIDGLRTRWRRLRARKEAR